MTTSKQIVRLTDSEKRSLEIKHKDLFTSSLGISEKEKAFALIEKGFDPAFHLLLYHDKVTTTIDGVYAWALKDPRFSRIISTPIMDASLKEAYGLGEDEIGVLAEVYEKDHSQPFCTGFGRASKDAKNPVIRGSAVESFHPYRMAEKRAEAQALRKFRPIGVDVPTKEEIDTIVTVVEKDTGMIVEAQANTVPEEAIEGAESSVSPQKTTKPVGEALGLQCPEHKVKWIRQSKEGTEWLSHKDAEADSGWCNSQKVFELIARDIAQEQMGWSLDELRRWVLKEFHEGFFGSSPEKQVLIIDGLKFMTQEKDKDKSQPTAIQRSF